MKDAQSMSPESKPQSAWSEEDDLRLEAKMEAARQIRKKYAGQTKTEEEEMDLLDLLDTHSEERLALEKTILAQKKAEQNK